MTQNASDVTAVVLAGGLGTRLRSVVSDRPKVLADILGKPFMAYLLEQIASAGMKKAVICSGYMAEKLEECFGSSYAGLDIAYSREENPLGTGGAVRLALPKIQSPFCMVFNGDSYIDCDLPAYLDWFFKAKHEISLLLTDVPDTGRFGKVTQDAAGIIQSFEEKTASSGPGWINAGIYIIKTSIIQSIPENQAFSLEKQLFPALCSCNLAGFKAKARFIDIGTPESYSQARDFFRSLQKR